MATYYVTTSGNNGNAGTSEGAAWADPGYAATQLNSGDVVHIKSGTYTITTSTPGANGPAHFPSNDELLIQGYETTPGDMGAKPIISAGSIGSINIFFTNGNASNKQCIRNIAFDGNNQTSVNGISTDTAVGDQAEFCEAYNCTNGFHDNGLMTYRCQASNCTNGFNDVEGLVFCTAESCGTGFATGLETRAIGSIAYNCTSHGFNISGNYGSVFYNCIAYGNGGNGFHKTAVANNYFILSACISVSNTGYGYSFGDRVFMEYCAGYDNGSGNIANASTNHHLNFQSLSGDPFIDGTNGDFNINDTAGAGATLREISITL